MTTFKKSFLLALVAAIFTITSCKTTEHHWHKTTKEERKAKK